LDWGFTAVFGWFAVASAAGAITDGSAFASATHPPNKANIDPTVKLVFAKAIRFFIFDLLLI
jgi:hypothetical protein